MAGTDNDRNTGSRRVNMKIWGGVPSFNRNLFRHQLSCLLVLRLLSYASSRRRNRRRNMDKMGKTFLGIIFTFGAFLLRFFGIGFSFHILSAIKLLNDLKVKVRTEFPNVWGEYKIPWQSLYTGYYRTL